MQSNESHHTLNSNPSAPALAAMQELLEGFARSASTAKRTWARRALKGLRQLQAGDRNDRILAWYFLTFCLGWRYGVRHHGGILTRHGGVGIGQLRKHLGVDTDYSMPSYLACRPTARIVSWVAVDLDEGSPYHPGTSDRGTFEGLVKTFEAAGLKMPLVVRSSLSGGVHLWYPLAEAVSTFQIAKTLSNLLASRGFEISNGVLELRPNLKSYEADYALIRLPLSGEGNEFWVDGFGYCDDIQALYQAWQARAKVNQFEEPKTLRAKVHDGQPIENQNGSKPRGNRRGALDYAHMRIVEGFTTEGQSQELKLMAQQIARFAEGQSSIEGLRRRCQELLMQAPGFNEFCGHRSEIISGRYWGDRELKRLLKMPVGGYHGTRWEQANQRRAADALARAQDAMDRAEAQGFRYATTKKAISALRELGAPANSWWTNSNQKEILDELKWRLVTPGRLHPEQAA